MSIRDIAIAAASTPAADEPETPVIFRIWKHAPHSVLALFPTLPHDNGGLYCMSFEHIGQHSAADYYGCIQNTRPAKPAEYRALQRELAGRGYNLKILLRAMPLHHSERIDTARKQ